jgi:hypothetical protein
VPISYRIEIEESLLVVEIQGRVTPEDVVRYRGTLLVDPEFVPGMNTLVDGRLAETEGLNASDLQFLADDIHARRKLLARARCAVVVESETAFGLMRMYEVYTLESPVIVRVFREESEARLWLEIQDPA